MKLWHLFILMKTDQNMTTMNKWEDHEPVWRSIEKLRWLQVRELAIKYPNDADLGAAVKQLIRNTPETI